VINVVLFASGLVLIRGLVALVMFLPSLAVGIRRMHDSGRSGWWIWTSLIPPWGIYLLCTPSRTVNNPYASGYTLSDANVVSTSNRCESCGKMRLPGQTYCVGCGAKIPD
jgi:hypothetical protein